MNCCTRFKLLLLANHHDLTTILIFCFITLLTTIFNFSSIVSTQSLYCPQDLFGVAILYTCVNGITFFFTIFSFLRGVNFYRGNIIIRFISIFISFSKSYTLILVMLYLIAFCPDECIDIRLRIWFGIIISVDLILISVPYSIFVLSRCFLCIRNNVNTYLNDITEPPLPIPILQEYKYQINDKEQDNLCAICQQDYVSNDVIKKLPCPHKFHKRCIDEWFKKSLTCPLCRRNVNSDNHNTHIIMPE